MTTANEEQKSRNGELKNPRGAQESERSRDQAAAAPVQNPGALELVSRRAFDFNGGPSGAAGTVLGTFHPAVPLSREQIGWLFHAQQVDVRTSG